MKERLEVRLDKSDADAVRRAANKLAMPVATYLRSVLVQDARRVLEKA